jgi:hypothetical protein
MDIRLMSKLGGRLLSKLVDSVQRADRFVWGTVMSNWSKILKCICFVCMHSDCQHVLRFCGLRFIWRGFQEFLDIIKSFLFHQRIHYIFIIYYINGGKLWQTTPKNLPRMQCTRTIPVAWRLWFLPRLAQRLNTNNNNNYINNKIYIKIHIKIAPPCFGLTTILRELKSQNKRLKYVVVDCSEKWLHNMQPHLRGTIKEEKK